MANYYHNAKPYVDLEFELADRYMTKGDLEQSFEHLENAHILGQYSTRHHVRSHYKMLLWAIKFNKPYELMGQVVRIIGAGTKTYIGLVPTGNTGGSNVSPLKTLPLSSAHEKVIRRCKANK